MLIGRHCKGHACWYATAVGNSRGNPKLVWHPARLIKEGGCVDLLMDTRHLKYPFVICGSEASALTLPLCLRSPSIISIFHCYSTMTKGHFLEISYGSKLPLFVDVRLNTHSFIHSFIEHHDSRKHKRLVHNEGVTV